MFPFDAADQQAITVVLPNDDNLLSSYSYAQRAFFGHCLRAKKVPPEVLFQPRLGKAPLMDEDFLNAWMPLEPGGDPIPYLVRCFWLSLRGIAIWIWLIFLQKHQLRVFDAHCKRLEKQLKSAAYAFRLNVIGMLSCATSAAFLYCFGGPVLREFGANGVFIMDFHFKDPEPPASSWSWWPWS